MFPPQLEHPLMNIKTAVLVAVLAASVGCTNTTDPVITSSKCIRSHTEYVLMPMFHSCGQTVYPNGSTQSCTITTYQPVAYLVCDQKIYTVRPNPNYRP